MVMYRIEHYVTAEGRHDPYLEWLRKLRDSRVRIAAVGRTARIEQGNFGDDKFCKDGVWEMRLDIGPGFRIYYALSGRRVVLLLGGGDKGTQAADINAAIQHWKDWQQREDDEKQIP